MNKEKIRAAGHEKRATVAFRKGACQGGKSESFESQKVIKSAVDRVT
jgi:hypothetical protein